MKDFMEEAEFIKNPHDVLRRDLLAGIDTPEVFLEKVRELDQSSDDRGHSVLNLQMLESPDIRAIFERHDFRDEYYAEMAFAAFHSAQVMSVQGDVEMNSLLQKTLSYLREIKDITRRPLTIEYVEGTVAYLNNDISLTREIIGKLSHDETNRDVLERLLSGLTQRGYPDYSTDY